VRVIQVNGHGHYPFSVECACGNLSSWVLSSFWSTGETLVEQSVEVAFSKQGFDHIELVVADTTVLTGL